jgi:hypothetical protein
MDARIYSFGHTYYDPKAFLYRMLLPRGSSGKTMWISLQSPCYLMVIKPLRKPWLFTIIHFASGLLSNLLDCMVSKLQAFYGYQKTMIGSALSQIFTNVFFSWASLISFYTLQICSDLKYSQENVL